MPQVNLTGVNEMTGDFQHLEPGAYICKITRIEPHGDKKYWFVEWDVAEGDFADTYEDATFSPRDVFSWKETALGMLKHRLHILAQANINRLTARMSGDDFVGLKEFDEDDLDAFIGCRFGAVIRKSIYTKSDGSTGEGIEIARWVDPGDVNALAIGFKADPSSLPKPRDTRDQTQAQQAQQSRQIELAQDDIPF